MRVLYPVGTLKDGAYSDGVIDTSKTMSPSIWNVALQFARQNSDRMFCYVGALKRSDATAGRVEFLPLKGINGCLIVFHVGGLGTLLGLESILMVQPQILQLFAYVQSEMIVDAVMLPHPIGVHGLHFGLAGGTFYENRPVIAVRVCESIWGEGSSLRSYNDKSIPELPVMEGYALADRVFTTGAHLKPQILSLMKNELAFSRVREAEKRIEYVSHGVPLYDAEVTFSRGRVAGYFGRFSNTDKRTDVCFKVLDDALRRGIIDRAIATSSMESDASNPLIAQYPSVTFSVETQDYVMKAMQCRCSVLYFTTIACPTAMLDLMAYGVLPIVPNMEWSQQFFKQEFPDYPFLFDSVNDIAGMMKLIMDDDALYQSWAERMSSRIRERYGMTQLKRHLYDRLKVAVDSKFDDVSSSRSVMMTGDLDTLRSKYRLLAPIERIVARLGDEFTFKDVLAGMKREKVVTAFRKGVYLFDNAGVHRFVQLLGYEDTLDSHVMKYRRIG